LDEHQASRGGHDFDILRARRGKVAAIGMGAAVAVLPSVEAQVTFLKHEEGGRVSLPSDLGSGQYWPHLVVQSPAERQIKVVEGKVFDDHLGVRFVAGPTHPVAGQSLACRLELVYYPNVDYSALQPGATFTVREGGKVVGFGEVVARH